VKDACKALEATINHIMEGPYADRFIGFHICFGGTCELIHWGNGGSKKGDFSVKHTLDFFDWAVEKYGSIEKLRKAWNLPELTRENAFVPPAAWREPRHESPETIFCKDGKGKACMGICLSRGPELRYAFLEGRSRKAVLCPKDNEKAASLAGFNIPLVAKEGICMLHGHGTDIRFLRKSADGWKLAVIGIYSIHNIVPHQTVQLKIYGTLLFIDYVSHLVI
jgi:hypothetical protein